MNVRVLSAPAMFSPRLLARTQTARRLRPGKSVRENLPLGFRLSSGLSTSTAAFGADLRDKVIIVTGGASGIGLATVRLLLSAGSKVFACDFNKMPSDEALQTPALKSVQCDLTQEGAPQKVVDDCIENFGPTIYGLCNIAGVMDTNNSADTLTNRAWEKTLAVNLTAPVYLMRAVLPSMVKSGQGSIVNVASKAGTSGAIAGVAYTASKHAIVGATKNVAWRFADEGIRCNAICPGGVATNITNSINMDELDHGAYARLRPVHDLHSSWQTQAGTSTPEQQASVIAFLLSEASSFVSGAIVPTDRAWSTL